jgi:hypothetical protein
VKRPTLTNTGDGFVVVVDGDPIGPYLNFADAKEALRFATEAFDAGFCVFPCGWLYQVPTYTLYPADAEWYPDSPSDVYTTLACSALAIGDERSWVCEHGHEHVHAEARHNEGWDYYDDDEIAAFTTGNALPAGGVVTMAGARLL